MILIIEGLEDTAHGHIERFDERGVGGVEGLGVGRDAFRRRRERDVRVVEGDVEQERLGLAALDELHGRLGLTELALAALRRFGTGERFAGKEFIKAVVRRLVAFAAQVPLADETRGIAFGLQQLGDCLDAVGQVAVLPRAEQAVRSAVGAAGQETRDLEAGGTLPGEQSGAGSRAHRSGGIALREARALGGEPIQVRGALILAAKAAQVVDA
ncbi:MAG: hypothetical protein LW857_02900 [Verrucomicrobiae bacterium]|nr:hypothetical protein [Verrucomicrobiae bacterium]